MDPLLIIRPSSQSQFSNCACLDFEVPDGVMSMAAQSLGIKKRVQRYMDNIVLSHPNLQLFLPAFHPWNIFFLRWAAEQNITTTLAIHDYKTHTGEASKVIEKLQQSSMAAASRVLFLTHYIKDLATRELGPSDRYIVYPHPIIDAGVINNLAHSSRPRILFLGRVVAYKGIDLLLEAIKELDIENLTIAGEQHGVEIQSADTVDVINRYLSPDEIPQLLATHHILAVSYTHLTLPTICSV